MNFYSHFFIKKIVYVVFNQYICKIRRYGKDKIQKDIKEQGTPATPLQRAMIDLNDVRNLYVKLSDRGIKDLLGGGQNFTEEDCRKISAIVKTFKQQAESIINKKK